MSYIVFFKANRQLAIYNGGTITEAWLLRKTNQNNTLTNKFIKLYIDSSGILKAETAVDDSGVELTSPPINPYYETSIIINMGDNKLGDIWTDDNCLIVGTGDIRNLSGGDIATLHKFKIDSNYSVILSSESDRYIKLYYMKNKAGAYTTVTIPSSIIKNGK